MAAHHETCEASETRSRPGLTVAGVLRSAVAGGLAKRPLALEQAEALDDIVACRTAALGGHADICTSCGLVEVSYNSCGNRHCPVCQWKAQQRWIEGRLERVLDTHYFHVVFTLPNELHALALSSPREVYGLLFEAASQTLLELGRGPKWLGAELGITMVLHTWTRDLRLHPHVHCLVTGGGLASDGATWVSAPANFLFPVHVLGDLFRGKFLARLKSLYRRGKLQLRGRAAELDDPTRFQRLLARLYAKSWIVYAKRPMNGSEQVITYLGRYTHRVAISNNRLIAVDDDKVTFRTRGNGTATLTTEQFARRFLLHVLPKGFVKIRHYGLLAAPHIATKWQAAHDALTGERPSPEPLPDARTDAPAGGPTPEPLRCTACGNNKVLRILFRAAERPPQAADAARGPPVSCRRTTRDQT